MKLQAKSSSELNKALQKAAKCIKAKNYLPILNNVLLVKGADGGFLFTSSTGDAQLTVPAPLTVVDGSWKDAVAIPVERTVLFLSTLSDCVITFHFNEENHVLTLEYCTGEGDKVKTGNVSMTYSDGEEFPVLKALTDGATHISLPAATFHAAIKNSAEFVYKKDDLRPVMHSLYMDIAEDLSDISFVATNGNMLYRMSLSNNPATGGCDFYRGGSARGILFHSNNFRAVSVFEGCESVDIEADDSAVRITADGMELICKSVEGKYPNYKAIIPRDCPYNVCFDKKEMLSILKRVSLFGSKTENSLKLTKSPMFLDVSARDIDYSTSAEDQVTIINAQCDDGFAIGFNVTALASSLAAIPGDTVRMQLTSASRAAVFTDDTPAPTVLALCMPMIID